MNMGLNPTTQANWVPTKWSLLALEALEAPQIVTSRVNDRSSEVTGEPMQVLKVPDVEQMEDSAVGDMGEVSDSEVTDTIQTITMDQWRHVSIKFANNYALQVAMKESTYPARMGKALKRRFEQYVLSLETGASGAALRNVAGSIDAGELELALAYAIANDWPEGNRHGIVSGNQCAEIVGIDRFSESTFVGTDNLPVITGKLKTTLGFEMGTSSLVRRRAISGTDRTINMFWVGKGGDGGGAFAKAIQQGVQFSKKELEDLAHRVIGSTLYGGSLMRNKELYLVRTTDS
jgi:hypothetical protein